jgi:hypothetical protein
MLHASLPIARAPARGAWVLRAAVLMLAWRPLRGAFFRNQIANGSPCLLGDRHDAVIALSIMSTGATCCRRGGVVAHRPTSTRCGHARLRRRVLLLRRGHADLQGAGRGSLPRRRADEHGHAGRRLPRDARPLAAASSGLPFGWSLLGAALFTLSNNLFIRASHAQLFSIGFLPVLATLLHAAGSALLGRRPRALLGWGAAFVLLFAALLMTGFYMAWYFVFLAAGHLPRRGWPWPARRRGGRLSRPCARRRCLWPRWRR